MESANILIFYRGEEMEHPFVLHVYFFPQPISKISTISDFFENVLKLFHQFLSMLAKSLKLFSPCDFLIFTDPRTPGSVMGWEATEMRKKLPLLLSLIIEPVVRGSTNV